MIDADQCKSFYKVRPADPCSLIRRETVEWVGGSHPPVEATEQVIVQASTTARKDIAYAS